MASRKSGDVFEYSVVEYFLEIGLKFYDDKSQTKFNKLKDKIDDKCKVIDKRQLQTIFNDIGLDDYNKIKFTTDNDGKKGNVSDIELYDKKNNHIGFSCKVNNISVKHQRPSALYKQCSLNDKDTDKYKKQYKEVNDKWFGKINELGTFDKIEQNEKNNLYKDFNKLTKKYLEKLNKEQVGNFYSFLIQYKQIYVLKHDTKKNQIILHNYIETPIPKKIISAKINDNHITINFDNEINIDLRLHNASKRITKSLSLKYDTKLLNSEKLFTTKIFELTKQNNKFVSLLRYPGGKSKAIKILEKYIPNNIDELYSPFFGGGSFELFLTNKHNMKIFANDKFEPLINFWKLLKKNSEKIVKEVNDIHPITKDKFNEYKENLQNEDIDKFIRGAYYYAINRSSFSGSTTSGGFSKESAKNRFNKASIERLEEINLDNIEFSNKDFTKFIDNIPDEKFIFLDPPYYLGDKSKLYGNNGDLHENFNHKKLSEILKTKNMWLLCYNDCEFIRKLYKKYEIIEVAWNYGMNKSKKSSEIIILSNELSELLK